MAETDHETLEQTTRYDPGEVEARILERWLGADAFDPGLEAAGSGETGFAISIPPPNVTGVLHMGHALNGSIQDALTRISRMRGRPTLWALGTDHAGIATQSVVEKGLRAQGLSRHDLGREEFERRVWEWREDYGSRIVEQYKRLGASCDYERRALHPRRATTSSAVMTASSSLAATSKRLHLPRQLHGQLGPGNPLGDLRSRGRDARGRPMPFTRSITRSRAPTEVLTVATVRPETMLGDSAVAVNPDDERYSRARRRALRAAARRPPAADNRRRRTSTSSSAPGRSRSPPAMTPMTSRSVAAHGLEEIGVIGEDGLMSEPPPASTLRGMTRRRRRAQKAVVEALREEGSTSRASTPYTHSVPFSRALRRARIEPLISPAVVLPHGRAR